MVQKKKIVLAIAIIIILVALGILFYLYNNQKESFSVKTFLLKLNMPLGGESVYKVKVLNNGNTESVFNAYLDNLENIAYIDDNEFTLGPNEGRDISVYFKDKILKVGVYPGKLVISDKSLTKEIPVIITLEDSRTVLSLITSEIPEYRNVYPGGKLGVEIKVYDLDEIPVPSVRAKYSIKNLKGDVLWADEGDLVIDGSKTEIVDIPTNWPIEDYVFVAAIEYRETNSISSYFFSLSGKSSNIPTDFNTIILVLIALAFILGFIVLFFYFIKSRDEFLIQLKKQQGDELSRNIQLIESSKKKIEKLPKQPPAEKKIKIQRLEKIKKKVIKAIKKKHAIQGKELKKLKKLTPKIKLVIPKKELRIKKEKKKPAIKIEKRYRRKEKAKEKAIKKEKRAGPVISSNEYRRKLEENIRKQKVDEIKNKLKSWKNAGYKFEAEGEIKKIINPKKQIENWNRQGYKK